MIDMTKIEVNDVVKLRNGEECVVVDIQLNACNNEGDGFSVTLRDKYAYNFDCKDERYEKMPNHMFSTTFYQGGRYLLNSNWESSRDIVKVKSDIFGDFEDNLVKIPPIRPAYSIINGDDKKIIISDGQYEFDGQNHWFCVGRIWEENYRLVNGSFSFNPNAAANWFIKRVQNEMGDIIYDYEEENFQKLCEERRESGFGSL